MAMKWVAQMPKPLAMPAAVAQIAFALPEEPRARCSSVTAP